MRVPIPFAGILITLLKLFKFRLMFVISVSKVKWLKIHEDISKTGHVFFGSV